MKLLEREPLLASLQEVQAGTVDSGGAVVFLVGEAGIGKSVLVRTFCDRLPAGTAVHYGFCDALGTPRALGPLHDIARADPDGLGRLLATGDRYTLFTEFLDLLAAGPSVTVIEDAHWADDATLDLLLFAGRRVAALPTMLIVTYRSEEVGRDHPLRRVLGDLATSRSVRCLDVPALTRTAVDALAHDSGRDGAQLHAVTGGNPFFVTETLRSWDQGAPAENLPATVRDAVLARVSRQDAAARTVLDLVSLVPDRAEIALLEKVAAAEGVAADAGALDDGIRSGMLVLEGRTVRFRHELARRAIEGDVPVARAAELHGRILEHLAATDSVDPARLSYHADAAGDTSAVLRYAPDAARAAAGLGAHREAAAHYARALRHAVRAPTAQQADLWECRADVCDRADELTDALDASARAVELWRAAGDDERAAGVMAGRSFMLWKSGRSIEAHATARGALALLGPLPLGPGLGRATSALARLRLVAGDMPGAIALGSTAIMCAERCGDVVTSFFAQGVVGSSLWMTDPDRAVELLTSSLDAARGAGNEVGVGLALSNLGMGAVGVRRYDLGDRWLGEAVSWCAERDLDASRAASLAVQARSWLEQGRWAEAAATAAEVIAGRPQHVSAEIVALTVQGRLRARRGDPDAQVPLDRAWTLAERPGDLPGLWSTAAARAEVAWLGGVPDRIEELVADTYRLAVRLEHGWAAGELGHWLSVAGCDVEPAAWTARPWALQAAGEWAAAAQLWGELGCPYEAAMAMAGGGGTDQQLLALDELQRLGAWAAAESLARRLRERGVRRLLARPRRSTLDNPAQLTDRQVDVVELLADGLRNVDIAARLHISPKTVDHHVSAILAKLGVGSRREAGKWARRPVAAASPGRVPGDLSR